MHTEAYQWLAAHADAGKVAVLDIGGRDINGTPRPLYPAADPYVVLDIADGPGVDIVADAATWKPDRAYDVVVCAEVFEHTPDWRKIIATARRALRPGGLLVATMAGPGRQPHSAVDGGPLRPGEYYANVDPGDLRRSLARWRDVSVDVAGPDVRAVATRAGK